MTLINAPALFATLLTLSLCASLGIVWGMEGLGYTSASLRVLFFCCVACVCLFGVLACVFWPVVGVIV